MVVKLISHARLPAANSLGYNPFIQAKALNACQIELPFSALKGPTTTMHA
jgi:hypothetical protein